jgi:hypothetical protein
LRIFGNVDDFHFCRTYTYEMSRVCKHHQHATPNEYHGTIKPAACCKFFYERFPTIRCSWNLSNQTKDPILWRGNVRRNRRTSYVTINVYIPVHRGPFFKKYLRKEQCVRRKRENNTFKSIRLFFRNFPNVTVLLEN